MSGAPPLPEWPYPRAIAHRGAGMLAPENTLAAFRHGASFGYRMFEFDVRLSNDGVAVLLHDVTLDRTTSGHGRLDALPFSQIAQLDAGSWYSPAYAGEPVSTLAAIARYLRANDLLANIEIKPSPGAEWRTGVAVALSARTLWAGADAPPLLSSFSEKALAAARATAPELPRALLFDVLPDDWRARLRGLDCVALIVNHRILTPDLMAEAHTGGFRVGCYTVNDVERAQWLWAAGLDSLITDAVDRISSRQGMI